LLLNEFWSISGVGIDDPELADLLEARFLGDRAKPSRHVRASTLAAHRFVHQA